MTLDDLLKSLPSLSDDQLKQIELRCQFLRTGPRRAKRRRRTEPVAEPWLLNGILHYLYIQGLAPKDLPLEMCRNIEPRCENTAALAQRLLLEGTSKPLNSAELLALGVAAAEALAAMIGSQGPVGLKRMLENLYKVPDAFDANFPGYIRSGMVNFVVRRR